MKTPNQRLRDTWLDNGLSIEVGAERVALDSFEREHRLTLPTQFRNYLLTANGMADGQVDESMISFLPLHRIVRELESQRPTGSELVELLFAEYLMFSHHYVLRATTEGVERGVYAADGTNEKQIAETFEQFVAAYLSNPNAIAHCW